MKNLFSLIVLIMTFSGLFAQESKEEKKKDVFEILSTEDSISHAKVNFHQDKRIEKVVVDNSVFAASNVHGFRVQIFSSNVQRTAKEEAFALERNFREAFPDVETYVTYSSPFWKVRVGDFRTQEDAKVFTEKIFEIFPRLKGQTYTVRDKISLAGSK